MIKKIFLFFLFINFTLGCTKDDVCSGETPTTPKLVIIFKSKINPILYKEVTNLTITTIVDNDTIDIIKSVTTDSIVIPLNTALDISEFQFISDNINDNEGNSDNVTFTYQRENVYINRACSFKAIYHELISQFEVVEGETWIKEININETTVEDENKTHVTIFH